MANDIFEMNTDSVRHAVGFFNSKKSLFDRANRNYKSSYLCTGPATVKKINSKYGLDSTYSSLLSSYSSLVSVSQDYLDSCIALENLLQGLSSGKIDPSALSSLNGMQELLREMKIDSVDFSMLNDTSFAFAKNSAWAQFAKHNMNNSSLAYESFAGAYLASAAVDYVVGMFKSQAVGNAYEASNYNMSRSDRSALSAYFLAKFILEHNFTHDREAAKKYPSAHQSIQAGKTSCSNLSSIALQVAGCLDAGKSIRHTTGVDRGGPKITGNIDTRFEGIENLKNCTVVNYKIDNVKTTTKNINKTCKIVDDKRDEFPKYKDLPDEYKKPGTVYIYDSHACVNVGNDTVVSLRLNDGDVYGPNASEKVFVNSKDNGGTYPFDEGIVDVIIPD